MALTSFRSVRGFLPFTTTALLLVFLRGLGISRIPENLPPQARTSRLDAILARATASFFSLLPSAIQSSAVAQRLDKFGYLVDAGSTSALRMRPNISRNKVLSAKWSLTRG